MHFPHPLPASQVLADFVCRPVAMAGTSHLALIRDLHSRVREHDRAGDITFSRTVAALVKAAEGSTGPLPWEEAIHEVRDGIAFLRITGPLVKGYDDYTCWCYGLASSDRIQAALGEIDLREDVHTLILLLNTPGGMATGIPEIGDQLVDMGARRAVVSFSSDLFASAGYWIAAGASIITATKSTIVGSIGTYIALYDYTKMLEEWGIRLELFRAGELKAIGLPGKELTDKERAFLQETTARTNAAFTGFVKSRRGKVESSTMQGQWFDGTRAAELGLVDRIVTGLPELVREISSAKNSSRAM